MASKNKNKGSGRRTKTPGQTSASNPNPTATSPSVSSPTGDATTTSPVPSSGFPSAPPTTTRLIPLASPKPTSILPSSASEIITSQLLPSPPPLPVQETQQEFISSTSDGSTTTGLAGPSTSTSALEESARIRTLSPIKGAFSDLFPPAVACAMTALQRRMVEDPEADEAMIAALFSLPLDKMELMLQSLLGLVEVLMKGTDTELKLALGSLFDMQGLRSAIKLTEVLLAERKKRHGSGGSCGGSKGGDGSPDGGSGEGDGEGGGVSA